MATHDRLAHYQESLGNIPPAISTMFDMDADFAGHYTDIRELIYTARADGLPLAVKELLLTMFDLAVSNPDGGINHLRAARRAGLTATQLREALLIAFLVMGVGGWGKVGYKLWAAWQRDFAAEEVSANGHAS
jgi:alkylhydroperoxidase/carboxymuconolactone decarboxylase family protein YurZ